VPACLHVPMRMRGLEPPPSFLDTDLNRARLPIPPHPRAGREAKISHKRRDPPQLLAWRAARGRSAGSGGLAPSVLLASTESNRAAIVQGTRTPPSHGGNRGSNPLSGTELRPVLAGRSSLIDGTARSGSPKGTDAMLHRCLRAIGEVAEPSRRIREQVPGCRRPSRGRCRSTTRDA
jgi:hypothetical protein